MMDPQIFPSTSSTAWARPWLPESWEREADVVVVGYGATGAVAAITVAEAGKKAIILEKAPEPGGSSSTSSGGMRDVVDVGQASRFIKNLGLGSIDDETALAFAETWTEMRSWLEKHGADLVATGSRPRVYGNMLPPQYFEVISLAGREGYSRGCGRDLFAFLEGLVRQRDVEVLLGAPARRLSQNPVTKEILGVVAESQGREIFLKARRAGVMACGGFAGNPGMLATYVQEAPVKMYPTGTPYCTGDGIRMVLDVGADLWHMNAIEWATQSFKPPEMPAAFWLQPKAQSWINVNSYGRRFRDESISFGHAKRHLEIFDFAVDYASAGDAAWPNSPWYIIFDEKVRTAGPIVLTERFSGAPRFITYNEAREIYSWSQDNAAEIKRGWIETSDTISGLADKIGIDKAGLTRTIDKYNGYCAAASDTERGRKADTLVALDRPPYYAMECVLGIINTQGGPRRNARSQVVSALDGFPVPRLYAGGEFGSIWNFLYPGAANLSECIVSGLICGRNAAHESPWE